MCVKSGSAGTRQRYCLTLGYDGTPYAGWQVQPNHTTVQQVLEETLHRLTGEAVKVHGSGRTDQGVHARGQVAHVDLSTVWVCDRLRKGMNALLPPDIRVFGIRRVHGDFHARRSAVRKEYRYFLWNDEVMNPCQRLYAVHIRKKLDLVAMRAAADILVGRHDFASFTANPNREVESTVREVHYIAIRKSGPLVTIAAASEGFLYKMVRSICGMLIRVGEGDLAPADIRAILASRIRTARVPTAPACGLFLWKVWY